MFTELGCLVLHIPGGLVNPVPAIYTVTFLSLCQNSEQPQRIFLQALQKLQLEQKILEPHSQKQNSEIATKYLLFIWKLQPTI